MLSSDLAEKLFEDLDLYQRMSRDLAEILVEDLDLPQMSSASGDFSLCSVKIIMLGDYVATMFSVLHVNTFVTANFRADDAVDEQIFLYKFGGFAGGY
ncbi:hypothetical protein BaRGS_00033439 [Batillaria attramentaria]|uniref:Uncharacterized protein n=1 Tax=Batillaria attramentaria TaxID=370345 RepID=A0ABD0JLE0_9CAEN